jgi:phage/plasmid-associated DNA primase
MSSQQLLRETQRAAGDEHLTSWHDTLISAGKERRELAEVRHVRLNAVQESNRRRPTAVGERPQAARNLEGSE